MRVPATGESRHDQSTVCLTYGLHYEHADQPGQEGDGTAAAILNTRTT